MEEKQLASWLIDTKLNQIKSICKLRFVMEKYAKFQRLNEEQRAKKVEERKPRQLTFRPEAPPSPSLWAKQVHS